MGRGADSGSVSHGGCGHRHTTSPQAHFLHLTCGTIPNCQTMGQFRDTQRALRKGSDLMERSSEQITKLPARAFDFKRCQRSKAAGERIYHQGFSLIARLVKNPPTMQETPVRFLGQEDPLEKGKATHSSILAWRIPWTV